MSRFERGDNGLREGGSLEKCSLVSTALGNLCWSCGEKIVGSLLLPVGPKARPSSPVTSHPSGLVDWEVLMVILPGDLRKNSQREEQRTSFMKQTQVLSIIERVLFLFRTRAELNTGSC